jgi:hypothetical protein
MFLVTFITFLYLLEQILQLDSVVVSHRSITDRPNFFTRIHYLRSTFRMPAFQCTSNRHENFRLSPDRSKRPCLFENIGLDVSVLRQFKGIINLYTEISDCAF